jgi:ribosomal protein S12 methylthiotransferase
VKYRVGFISLGCPKNQLDCELMISRACDYGFELATDIAEADAIVVNTCAFILPAQAEADEAIQEALAAKKHGKCHAVVVAGCLPQYLQQRCHERYPGVDAWLTPDNPGTIGEVLGRLLGLSGDATTASTDPAAAVPLPLPTFLASAADGRVLSTLPSLAYVKIAEGCNHECRFCIIPRLRGRYRSRPIPDIVCEVRDLVEMGIPEIVLVSQDSSHYGRDLGGDGLPKLLSEICNLPGDYWLRVMYLYPTTISPELLETWAKLSPKLLPYFDVPVQHVNREVLKRMGRGGDRSSINGLFAAIRRTCPEAIIRTSLIVGFPGETDEQFGELLEWVESGAVDRLGVFTYSDLPELASHDMPGHIEEDEMEHRRDLLMQAQQDVMQERQQAFIGSECDVLLEDVDEEHGGEGYLYLGRSWRDAYEIDGIVRVHSLRELPLYQRMNVRITAADSYDLDAEALQ